MLKENFKKVGTFIDCETFLDLCRTRVIDRIPEWREFMQLSVELPEIVVSEYSSHRKYFFLSHRWDDISDPDPRGWQLRAMRALCFEMELKGYAGWCFWYDYCSLPQKPRTAEEQVIFDEGLEYIGALCEECWIVSFVSGFDVKQTLVNQAMRRGWIFSEMMIATAANRVRWTFFEAATDFVVDSKSDRTWDVALNYWRDRLPIFDRRYLKAFFISNKIACTNGEDIDRLVEYLYDRFVLKLAANPTPQKLSNFVTYTLQASEVAPYYIHNGISPFYLDQYFECEYAAEESLYRVKPWPRPDLPRPNVPYNPGEEELSEYQIQKDGRSLLYPGLIFEAGVVDTQLTLLVKIEVASDA